MTPVDTAIIEKLQREIENLQSEIQYWQDRCQAAEEEVQEMRGQMIDMEVELREEIKEAENLAYSQGLSDGQAQCPPDDYERDR